MKSRAHANVVWAMLIATLGAGLSEGKPNSEAPVSPVTSSSSEDAASILKGVKWQDARGTSTFEFSFLEASGGSGQAKITANPWPDEIAGGDPKSGYWHAEGGLELVSSDGVHCLIPRAWGRVFEKAGTVRVNDIYDDILIVSGDGGASVESSNYFLINPRICKMSALFLSWGHRGGKWAELCHGQSTDLSAEVSFLERVEQERGYMDSKPRFDAGSADSNCGNGRFTWNGTPKTK